MAGKKTHGHHDRVLRKALTFERALHSWDRWLYSIVNGRKVLRSRQPHPSLKEMMNVAKKSLAEMEFPSCILLEVYWLCCVFANYGTKGGFKFDMLVLPDWFPSTFGGNTFSKGDTFGTFNFEGKRIYPPQVWDEADRKFWFEREPVVRYVPPRKRAEVYKDYPFYPNRELILVLPADHPVRKYIKRGRPFTTTTEGETILE